MNYHDDHMSGNHQYRTNEDAPIGPENPIELYADREVLMGLVRATIKAIKQNRVVEIETPEERATNDAVQHERERLLMWLEHQSDRYIFTGLYIASEIERAEEDDEDGDVPFTTPPKVWN